MKRVNDSYMTDEAFRVSKVSGITGLPVLSFTGEILAAHRIEATLMKSGVLAIRRPRQFLQQSTRITKTSRAGGLELLPGSKALFVKPSTSS
jgi:hypothetical protein